MKQYTNQAPSYLLEPGGYLQWLDLDLAALSNIKQDEYPRYFEINRTIVDAQAKLGFCIHAPEVVYEAAASRDVGGLVNVARHNYGSLAHPQPEMGQRWILQIVRAMVAVLLLRAGGARNEEAARRETEGMIGELEGLFANGVLPDVRFGVVVGQKA